MTEKSSLNLTDYTIVGVDVDTQIGFAKPEGHLYVPALPHVIPNIRKLCQNLPYLFGSVDAHSYDAWEFEENGGPFPRHCYKGTEDQLKIHEARSPKMRYIPMSEGNVVVGESVQGEGNRSYRPDRFVQEIRDGVRVYFEKEVYSLFSNPNAKRMIDWLVTDLRARTGKKVLFTVFGYCTGGFCVDAAMHGLKELIGNECAAQHNSTRMKDDVEVAYVTDAVAPLPVEAVNGSDPEGWTKREAQKRGIHEVTTQEVLDALECKASA